MADTNMKFLQLIKDFWFLAIFVTTIIVGWTNIRGDIEYHNERLSALELRSNNTDKILVQMATDIAYIRGKLEN